MRSFINCTLAEYHLNDQVKMVEASRECSTHGGKRGMHTGFGCESQKERDHSEDLKVCGRVILN
jgi:hypothetical protein